MKKRILVFVLVLLMVALCACGGGKSAETASQTSGHSTGKQFSAEGGASWEIGDPTFSVYYQGSSYEFFYYAVPVINTGSVDLFLKNMAYTFKYADGESDLGYNFDAFPKTLQPGETGWFCFDWNTPEPGRVIEDFLVKQVNVEVSNAKSIRYPVSDLVFSNDKNLTAEGIVENNTDETTAPFSIRIYIFDSNGTYLGDLTSLMVTLEPREKVAFKALSTGYAHDIQPSEIASYVVFACANSYTNDAPGAN